MNGNPPRETDDDAAVAVVFYATRRGVVTVLTALVVALSSVLILHAYVQAYDPDDGWTRMIFFGSKFHDDSLLRLQSTPHFEHHNPGDYWGYDGQFYAQLAIDPSLRDPGFDEALDMPEYRARRIAMPVLAYLLGGGRRWQTLQAYALLNGACWMVLAATLLVLIRPATVRSGLCVLATLFSFGVVASVLRALVDLPAATLLFVGLAAGRYGGLPFFATALLARETCLLGAGGFWNGRAPWRAASWKNAAAVSLATVPLGAWIFYVNSRFGHQVAAGFGNFGLPLQAILARVREAWQQCDALGWATIFRHPRSLDWLYGFLPLADLLTVVAIGAQAVFLLVRWDWRSPVWRVGAGYVVLALLLGQAVWDDTSAAARVLMPLTLAFYVCLARERPQWFWPFFVLGSLNVPYAMHALWVG